MITTVFCTWCGAPNAASHGFCSRCGRPLTRVASSPTPAASPPQPYAYPPPYGWPPRPSGPRADFSSILSGFFSAWGRDVFRYILVYLVVGLAVQAALAAARLALPTLLSGAVSGVSSTDPYALLVSLAQTLLIITALSFGITTVLTSLVAGGVVDFAVRRGHGERLRMRDSLRRGLRRFPRILGASFGFGLATTGLVIVGLWAMFAGFGGLTSSPTPGAIAALCGGVLLELACVVASIFLLVILFLYVPPIMLEGATAIGSLRRSWSMTRGHRLSLFAAILVVSLLSLAVSFAAAAGALLPYPLVLGPLVLAVATAISGSWTMILAAVTYDLILKEGGTTPHGLAPAAAAPAPRA